MSGEAPQLPIDGLGDGVDDERPHRSRVSIAPFLTGIGFLLLASGFSSAAYEFADEQFGIGRVLATASGFLFLYVAWLARGQARLRERLLDLMEEILKLFYGPNFRRDRQAIDILVRAMDSDNADVRRSSVEHLRRLTGQEFGDDRDAWVGWWSEARARFRAPGHVPPGPPPNPQPDLHSGGAAARRDES